MNYGYLKSFYAVARSGNISHAAASLEVSQPALSRSIAQLEGELGVQLFTRSKLGVSLTHEGEELFARLQGPFAELEKVVADLEGGSFLNQTTVHVGATATSLHCFVFRALENLRKMFPLVNFRIYSDSSSNLIDKVKSDIVDFAFVTTPPLIKSKEVETLDVYRIHNLLVAPVSYERILKGKVPVKKLKDIPFIMLSKDMQFREYTDEFLLRHGLEISPAYEIDSSSTLISFVEHDCGIAFIPEEMAAESIAKGKCLAVNLEEDIPDRFISFAMKKGHSHAKTVMDIRETILAHRKL